MQVELHGAATLWACWGEADVTPARLRLFRWALEALRFHEGTPVTLATVADALEVSPAEVSGGFDWLVATDYLHELEADVDGTRGFVLAPFDTRVAAVASTPRQPAFSLAMWSFAGDPRITPALLRLYRWCLLELVHAEPRPVKLAWPAFANAMSESSVSRHLNRLVHLGYLHEADRDDNRCHRLLLAWSNPPTTRTP